MRPQSLPVASQETTPSRLWEARYGSDAFQHLLTQLRTPCVSYAAIAAEFGVTRERVRQWRAQFLPDAPDGRRRRLLCREQRGRQRLLSDPLFRVFYRSARAQLGAGRVQPIRSGDGFRLRVARIDHHIVALRDATGARTDGAVWARSNRTSEFVFLRLQGDEFLFVSSGELRTRTPADLLERVDDTLRPCLNTFHALPRDASRHAL